MPTVKTSELTGAALDWAVAKATGEETVLCRPGESRFDIRGGIHCNKYGCTYGPPRIDGEHEVYEPSSDWEITGPLIEKYWYVTNVWLSQQNIIKAWIPGEELLVYFCRALVAAELGPEVEIPEELE